MAGKAEFFRLRDPRTREYGGDARALHRRVGLVIGDRAGYSRAGQMAALAAVNMAARVHRRVVVQAPRADLVAPAPFSNARNLADAMIETAFAISPYGEFEIGRVVPGAPSLGFGAAPSSALFHLGVRNATAGVSKEPLEISDSSGSLLGAGLAACLGTSALFRVVHDLRPALGCVSAWDLTEMNAASGPEHLGPLDVGDVALVGAGAVGQAIAYWTLELGHKGQWEVIDADLAELHNTNRSLASTPADAGWPDGSARAKARVAGELLGARAHVAWYDEWLEGHPNARPDLVIPAANGRGVRAAINGRGEPLLIHATTSRSWQAQLHRHIPERDGCITCRIEDADEGPELACSSAPVTTAGRSQSDAALPFLSAAAGLLVLSALYRLQLGELAAGPVNFWGLDFRGPRITVRRLNFSCLAGCASVLPATVRDRLNAMTRWRLVR